jgi:metallo-beta-lactamase class B
MALFPDPTSRPDDFSADVSDPARRRLMAFGCVCCLAAALPMRLAAAESAEVARHLAAAKEAAGSDLLTYLKLGDSAKPDYKPPKLSLEDLMRIPAPPPGRAFDNLYFVGSKWVSAWAIATSGGIIVIDAMDNDEEAQRIIDEGMRKLGLDPSQIKTVVITHGHGDHYGGANYLKRRYDARIVMSQSDWQMTETKLEFDSPLWGRPSPRDVSVVDGDTVKLGDTVVDVVATPGHTMGTISLIFPVQQGSKTHLALLWGGTAFNFGRQPARLRTYIESVERMREIVRSKRIDVFISNHNLYDSAVDKLASLQPDRPNPFVLGTETVQRALTVMSECAQANLASWEA